VKKIIIFLAILVVIVIQLSRAMGIRNYDMPRSSKTREAIDAYQKNPSEATMAIIREFTAQDASHNLRRDRVFFGLMIIGDIFAVCLCWNYAFKRPRPEKPQV
jgi:hypothetical protein